MQTHPQAWLFQGQGSQKIGMGYELCQKSPQAQALWNTANEILGFNLQALAFFGPMEQLTQTAFAQPAILTLGVSLARERGLKSPPDLLCGHSLGEYTALVVANSIVFEEAVWLVYQRGLAMQSATLLNPGSMTAVLGIEASILEKLCQEHNQKHPSLPVYVSNYNGPEQTVLSGHTEGLDHLIPFIKAHGAKKVIPLLVSAPFHCPLLKTAQEEFLTHLSKVHFKDADYPIISNVTATPIQKANEIYEVLKQQMTSPVRFTQVIKKILELQAHNWVEFGNSKILSSMGKSLSLQIHAEIYNGT